MLKRTLSFTVDKDLSDRIEADRKAEPVSKYLRRLVEEHLEQSQNTGGQFYDRSSHGVY